MLQAPAFVRGVIERKAAFRVVQISFSLLKTQPKFQHRNFANVIDENEPSTARKVWDGTLLLKDRPFIAKRTFEGMTQKTKPLPPLGSVFEQAHKGDIVALRKAPPSDLRETDETTGNTVLIWAAEGGSADAVAFLLALDPPIDRNAACSISGNTALLRSCRHGHTKVVETLLQANADASQANNRGQTPLHMSAFYRHRGCVEALLAAGADTTAKDLKSRTPDLDTQDQGIAELIMNWKSPA